MKLRQFLLVWLTALIFGGVSNLTIAAQTWNAADNFSAINNPNSAWKYGYESTLGINFIRYDVPTTLGVGLDYWTSSNIGIDPNVSHNSSASPVSAFDFVLQPNQTAFHPGPNGEFSIFRWTAPHAGTYTIHADFVGLGASSTTDVHILVNGSAIFNGAINGRGTTTSVDVVRHLATGSTVDFAVGSGDDGYISDTTGINASIQLGNHAQYVAEP